MRDNIIRVRATIIEMLLDRGFDIEQLPVNTNIFDTFVLSDSDEST